ncbi:LysE family translocator [Vibrio sp. SM6]|uniref:LysE family translocator n=1 Tax=Vibrio agarilyticus TaxID=2726741 RepID=A0A7X8TPF1_9VIBR|nr:LysE family translocator [Vibrio agarilyticus]NLS12349.1 LysE family translocator [Vibrio agarilyticus]
MSVEIWLMFSMAYLAVTLSPGPNVLLVVQNSIKYGCKSAISTIIGNLACQFIVVSMVAVGVGGIITQLPAWFFAMKCIGGVYLIYLGCQTLIKKHTGVLVSKEMATVSGAPVARILFKQAFVVSASNPKTLIFLSAFLPQFIDATKSQLFQFSIMYCSICLIVFLVHIAYALIFSGVGRKFKSIQFEDKLSKVVGGLFISMGGGILLSSRS